MKSLSIRLPDEIMARLAAESRERNITVSELVRESIAGYRARRKPGAGTLALIQDLVGSVKGLPRDLSARKKHYLKKLGYGKRHR